MDTFPLHFAVPSLADAPRVRECARHALSSDLSFANIYLLQEKYGTTIAFNGGFLFRHFSGSGRLSGYAFPCGEGDVRQAIELIRRDAAARHREARFCLLTPEQAALLRDICPDAYDYRTDRGDADYLYEQPQLATLPGAAYHGKRNHIAQFEREHKWHFETITDENVQDALAVAQAWLSGVPEPSPALQHEARSLRNALRLHRSLELFGGVLYAENTPAAMCLGSFISPGVADIHYEKCTPECKKAYPLINREMARALEHCRLINREEDLNQPGLRQAKLSYHPALVLEKFTAIPLLPC